MPSGSPSMIGVNGLPLLNDTMPPNCQPMPTHRLNPPDASEPGTVHSMLIIALCVRSKSDGPFLSAESKNGSTLTEFTNVSPAKPAEPVSRLRDQVYDPCICSPCDIRFLSWNWSELYQESLIHISPSMRL